MVSSIFYFHQDYIGNDPIWLVFFRGVETTNICIYIYIYSIDYLESRRSYEIEILESLNLCFRWFFILPTMGCTIKSSFGNLGIERATSCFFQLFSRRKSKNQDLPSIQPKKKTTQKKRFGRWVHALFIASRKILLHQADRYIYGVIWDL